MVLVQKSLQNAYIGEVLHISSDLRGATLAGLQAQGWTDIVDRFGAYTLDANGLSPNRTQNDSVILYKNVPTLNSNNIVKIKLTGYLQGGDNTRDGGLLTYMTNQTTFPSIYSNSLRCCYQVTQYQPPYNGIVYNDSTRLGGEVSGSGTGNVELESIVNLSTGEVEYKLTSPSVITKTATLNSTQLANVLTYKNLGVTAQVFRTDHIQRLYTVELTVE